jgi:hypothetical protein
MSANPETFAIDDFIRQSRARADVVRLTPQQRAERRKLAVQRNAQRNRLARQKLRDEGLFMADPGYPRGFDCQPDDFAPLMRAWGDCA